MVVSGNLAVVAIFFQLISTLQGDSRTCSSTDASSCTQSISIPSDSQVIVLIFVVIAVLLFLLFLVVLVRGLSADRMRSLSSMWLQAICDGDKQHFQLNQMDRNSETQAMQTIKLDNIQFQEFLNAVNNSNNCSLRWLCRRKESK
jgi:Na+-transporting methylmalonyl-CoA/oxaloacetate decarboxylase gamma subunit